MKIRRYLYLLATIYVLFALGTALGHESIGSLLCFHSSIILAFVGSGTLTSYQLRSMGQLKS